MFPLSIEQHFLFMRVILAFRIYGVNYLNLMSAEKFRRSFYHLFCFFCSAFSSAISS